MSFVRAIPSTAESAKQLIADAMAYLSQVQAEGKAGNVSEYDFRLALDKAVQNAYLHGNGYDEFGQRVQVKYGNDAVSTYEYDEMTRRLMHLKTVNKDGVTYQNIDYAYDKVGNILSKKNTDFITSTSESKTSEQTYAYDDLHRLTASNGTFSKESWVPFFTNRTNTYTNTFNYNSIGNILRKEQVNKGRFDDGSEVTIAPTTYTFDYEYGSFRPHAVTKAGTKSFTYDLNGNMLTQVDTASGLNRNIAWDDENRITSTNDSGTVTSYAYDDKGERVIKNGKFGNVVYVNNNFAVRNGTLKSKHIFAGNTRLASKLVDSGTDRGTYYYHADHLGSSNAITTKTGSFHEHIEYFPYGETWVEEKVSGGVELGYKFTAKELDAETGLYYFGARYYDAVLSRWVSVDPAFDKFLPKGTNNDKLPAGGVFRTSNLGMYVYSSHNPLVYIDPDGRWDENIHYGSARYGGTLRWAQERGITPEHAKIIAKANNATDSGRTNPAYGIQSHHFNTNNNPATFPDESSSNTSRDSRINLSEQHLDMAVQLWNRAETYKQGDTELRDKVSALREAALEHLGMGLHALQDVYAHSDEFVGRSAGRWSHIVTPLGSVPKRGKQADDPDVPGLNRRDRLNETKKATDQYIDRFKGATGYNGERK